jgi:hypothetical protein
MKYKDIFIQAYQAMDVSVMDGNCGSLCNGHCCRRTMENGQPLGIYFLPFEYECMQAGQALIDPDTVEFHTSDWYELPVGIDKLIYGFCRDNTKCIRELRPIQCRTYPLEAHIENGILSLVIGETQVHDCPILTRRSEWNPDFEAGILKGWTLLMRIPEIRWLIEAESRERASCERAN